MLKSILGEAILKKYVLAAYKYITKLSYVCRHIFL